MDVLHALGRIRDPFESWLFLCEKEVCFQAKVDRSKFEHVLLIKMAATGLFGRVGELRPERDTFIRGKNAYVFHGKQYCGRTRRG